jgi:hypothetical protein
LLRLGAFASLTAMSRRSRGQAFGVAGSLVGIAGALLYSAGKSHEGSGAGVLAAFAGFAAISIGGVAKYYGRQLAAKTMAETLSEASGATILYLRSFVSDQNGTWLLGATTGFAKAIGHSRGSEVMSPEERLAEVFKDYGRFIAIGRPDEALPALGAAREYVSNDQWQAEIARLMGDTALVVIHLGRTDGVWWELRAALAASPPRPLLVQLSPRGWFRRRRRASEVARLGEIYRETCARELPADAASAEYLYVDELRAVKPLPPQPGVDLLDALRATLGPALEALNPSVYSKQRRPRTALRRFREALFSHRLALNMTVGILAILGGLAAGYLAHHS